MTNYTDSEMRINNAYCKAYSGRMLRHNAVLKPARHSVAWISVRSPMMELVFEEVHLRLHCGLGPQSYINVIPLPRQDTLSFIRALKILQEAN